MTGDLPEYRLEKFIQGVVAKLIRSYKMSDFIVQSSSGRMDADCRADMIQTGWLAALQCQKTHPKESRNPAYLRQAVVNALLKTEQADRPRRDNRDDIDEAATKESKSTVDLAGYDLSLLSTKAGLTDSETTALELFYGLTDHGECTLRQIAHMMGKTEDWVEARINVAKIKLQIAAGR